MVADKSSRWNYDTGMETVLEYSPLSTERSREMASLKIKTGTPVKVNKGLVEINGPCVVLSEIDKNEEERMVLAYCLIPGETVKRVEGDDYIVEF